MPELVLKKTGETRFVSDEGLADALASGLYVPPAAGEKVAVELRPGVVGQTTVGELGAVQAGGANIERESSFRGRESKVRNARLHGGVGDKIQTFAENAINEATLGGLGVIGELAGGQDYTDDRLARSEANPISAGVGTATGIIAPALASGGTSTAARVLAANPLGGAAKLGGRIAKSGGAAASLASKAGRIAAGGAFEGGAQGLGQGIQELTDSSDPLTWERATSVLSSNVFYGAAIGGGANLAGAAVEKGLTKAKGMLDDVASRGAKAVDTTSADLAGLDSKALRTARETELGAIETARVPQRAQLADDIGAFRKEIKDQKVFLATKGAKTWEGVDDLVKKEASEIGKVSLEADKTIDRMLRNPKALASRPQRALDALQQQEAALERLAAHGDNLRPVFAADTTGERIAALNAVPGALERNRALQAKIADLTSAPSSTRLAAIDDAKDALVTGGRGAKGIGEQMLGGAAYSGAAGAASMIPVIGPLIAPFVGAKASALIGETVFGGLAKAGSEAAKRTATVVKTFLDVTRKVTPAAPVVATKVLSSVAYAPPKTSERPSAAKPTKAKLPELYRTRSDEVRSMVSNGPDGVPRMRREARAELAARLMPIAAFSPVLADRMETLAAKRLEFLAGKLPRRPDMGIMQTGPDLWQPSEMEMRTWARYAAAVEDPGAIEERMASGSITPEDAEVMREVYPERLAELQRQILEQLPTLQKSLPYNRRLALSIMTGIPVDASMHPVVLASLQSSFTEEPGTEGGTQAPKAQPAFGSVKVNEATPSQQRQQGSIG